MPRGLLTQAQQFGAEFVLHLRAVKGMVHVERVTTSLPKSSRWLRLDIVELDGEAVRGGGALVLA